MSTNDKRQNDGLAELLLPLIIAMLLSVAVFSQTAWQWRWLAIVVFLILGSIPAFLLLVRVTSQQYEQFKGDDEAIDALLVWESWREASLRAGYSSGLIDVPFVLTARDEDDSQTGHGAETERTDESNAAGPASKVSTPLIGGRGGVR